MINTAGHRLAFHHSPGTGPTLIFLPGYASDMSGSKAVAIEAWAQSTGRAFLRFDYAGCGESEGAWQLYSGLVERGHADKYQLSLMRRLKQRELEY